MKISQTLLFVLCILLSTIANSQQIAIDQVIAVVGNKIVKQSDIENEYNQLKSQGYPVDENTKCFIFEKILEHKLLVNQAMLDSIQVSEAQVESELTQRLSYFISQIGSTEKLEKYFGKSMQDIKSDLRESLREQQLSQKMQGNIIQDIEATPSEVKTFFNSMPKDSIPRINAQMELAQVAVYPAFTEKAVVDVKDRLLEMRKRIIGGERFSTLATLYSEDEGSAKHGGEIGFLTKAELDPDYAKAAFALNNPGDVSHIVDSQFGFHIIQLIEKKGDRVNTRHILMKPKPDPDAVSRAKQMLDSIANLIRIDSLSFEKAVALNSMDPDTRFNNGMVVNPATGNTKFETEQIAPSDYYAIKNLKVGEISNSFESRDKNGRVYYKIMKIKSKSAAHLADLKQDYNIIQELAKNSKKMDVLNKWYTEKKKSTFIQIDDSFKTCPFKSSGWLKSSN